MKPVKFIRAAVVMAVATCAATPTLAAPVCLKSYLIDHTHVNKDATAIDFYMKNGDVWRNTLRNKCQGLKWYGFVYVLHGPDEVCENLQAIRVIHLNETCLLGPFEKVSPKAAGPTNSSY